MKFATLIPRFAHIVPASIGCALLVVRGLLLAVPADAQIVTDLHDFNAGAGEPYNFNVTRLAQACDGNFYAESNSGGNGNGTVAQISTSGSVNVILNFNGTDGSNEVGGMTLGTDCNLYGNTWSGGTSGQGITFKITTAGVETPMHNFTNTGDGDNPANALILGNDGNFYGTSNGTETIYRVSPSGTFKTLHSFGITFGGGQLSWGGDGNIYGGMNDGGTSNFGFLYKMTTSGTVTVLHNFTGTDGAIGSPGMTQASNGLFYGTGQQGGTNNAGVVFKISSGGAYTLLHSLNGTSDGKQALVLLLATDGNFYGEAVQGGTGSCGTIFKVTPAGAFNVIYTFDGTHGCTPSGYLTQDTDGKLYGLTIAGGAHGNGTFFSLDLGLKPFISLQSTSGKVGSTVGILGQEFSSSSVVKFNGVQATKTVLTGTTYITATVPAGATDGYVTVTTGATTLTSTKTYIVHNSWSAGKAMPTPVWYPAGVGVISGQIYVVGGYPTSGYSVPLADTQIYNPVTNTWSSGVALPTGTAQGVAAVVKNVLYVIGGTTDGKTQTNAAWAFNPKTKTWSAIAAMPTASADPGVAVENNIIYVIGGYGSGLRLNTVQSYNPATGKWTTEAPLLNGKSEPSVGLVGTTIVAADGFTSSGGDNGDNEGYNASTNTWSSLKADPTARNGACAGSTGAQLYVAGGYPAGGPGTPAFKTNESFSVGKNTWTTLAPLPQVTVFAGATVDNGLLYCIGGVDAYEGNLLSNVQIYQP